jgi:hypothetical protein
MRTLLFLLTGTLAFADDDAAAIMTKVATNVEKSTDARRQYVYKQSLISNLVRSGRPVHGGRAYRQLGRSADAHVCLEITAKTDPDLSLLTSISSPAATR